MALGMPLWHAGGMCRCLFVSLVVLVACAGGAGDGARDDSAVSLSGGLDGSDDQPSPCPAMPHDPVVPIEGYGEYPVFIEGTDRRFVTIQEGIWGAEAGDTVVVCPGLYQENIDFNGAIIQLTSHAGPRVTRIDGGGTLSTVSLRDGEPPETVLEGFTIQGGDGSEVHGGGVFIEWGSPTLRYNVITANRAGLAGGVHVRNSGATVHNNIILSNDARESGGGIACSACTGAFRYNTMVDNTARDGHLGAYLGGSADFVGNVLVAKEGERGYAVRVTDWKEDREYVISHNLLWPNDFDWAGSSDGNRWDEASEAELRADPLFVDASAGDYRLSLGSPARDAGPAEDSDPDGSQADLGAFGGPNGTWPWN